MGVFKLILPALFFPCVYASTGPSNSLCEDIKCAEDLCNMEKGQGNPAACIELAELKLLEIDEAIKSINDWLAQQKGLRVRTFFIEKVVTPKVNEIIAKADKLHSEARKAYINGCYNTRVSEDNAKIKQEAARSCLELSRDILFSKDYSYVDDEYGNIIGNEVLVTEICSAVGQDEAVKAYKEYCRLSGFEKSADCYKGLGDLFDSKLRELEEGLYSDEIGQVLCTPKEERDKDNAGYCMDKKLARLCRQELNGLKKISAKAYARASGLKEKTAPGE